MIVFRESTNETNVIHIIVGPETEYQLDLSGHIVLSLDDKIDSNKKNYLFFNRCLCTEEDLKDQFDYFNPPEEEKECMKEIFKKFIQKSNPPNATDKVQNSTNNNVQNKEDTYNNTLKCPKCLAWGTFVKDGIATMCKTCKNIENGLEKITPISKKEKKILDSMIDKKDVKND
jgi:hypothetical protein